MTTIKSFTDISQSRKLAEILPLDSADMRIGNYVGESGKVDGTNIHYYPKGESFGAPEIIYAWSLAALLGVLPEKYTELIKEGGMYRIIIKDSYITSLFYSPIDACVAMIENLHELKML